MHYTQTISSPLGNILLSADEVGLTGLWFDGGRYYAETLPEEHVERETPILMDTKRWLDVYFTGREPDFTPPLHPVGSPFRQAVWQQLLDSVLIAVRKSRFVIPAFEFQHGERLFHALDFLFAFQLMC